MARYDRSRSFKVTHQSRVCDFLLVVNNSTTSVIFSIVSEILTWKPRKLSFLPLSFDSHTLRLILGQHCRIWTSLAKK